MKWFGRLRNLFRGERMERELDEELRSHIEMRVEENIRAGMSPEEARYDAQRRFGNWMTTKEDTREVHVIGWLEAALQDLKYGARMLRKNPGFSAIAVLTIALGTGANTAIFSLVDTLLLKSLPVKEAHRLFLLEDPGKFKGDLFRRDVFERIRAENNVLDGVCTFSAGQQTWNANIDGQSEPVNALLVSGEYHTLLGVRAVAGRTLLPSDDASPGASPAAVISYAYWERRFGRASDAVGKQIRLNGGLFTIVGVTPREFFGVTPGQNPEITVPHQTIGTAMPQRTVLRNNIGMRMLARLRDDITEAQAQASLRVLYPQILAEKAGAEPTLEARQELARHTLQLVPAARGVAELRSKFSKPLLVLLAIVSLLLLLACSNVAGLLTARNHSRQHELAVRLSIGAGRGRLIRQLLTESVLLSALGSFCGLLLAVWSTRFIPFTLADGKLSLPGAVSVDARVLLFTVFLSLLTGVLLGAAPAFRATRVNLTTVLNGQSVARGSRAPVGRLLVCGQIALSLLLLIAASLFVRSLQSLERVETGFSKQGVLLFRVDPTLLGYRDARYFSVLQQILERVESLPGVRAAAVSDMGLLSGGRSTAGIVIEGRAAVPGENNEAVVNWISPEFFKTTGMTLLQGRGFLDADRGDKPRVAVVSETLAQQFFAGGSPIGKRLRWEDDGPLLEIVGVVRDAKYYDLRIARVPAFFVPVFQGGWQRAKTFEIQTAGDPAALAEAVRQRVAEVDPDLLVFGAKTQEQQTQEALAVDRLIATVSGFFGLLALLLACLGLYGVLAYHTARRTKEMGIRLALGAQRNDVTGLVMRETAALFAAGAGTGLIAALLLSRFVSSLLFGISATDPRAIASAILLLLSAAMLAGYLPARRAARVDPMVALRYE